MVGPILMEAAYDMTELRPAFKIYVMEGATSTGTVDPCRIKDKFSGGAKKAEDVNAGPWPAPFMAHTVKV